MACAQGLAIEARSEKKPGGLMPPGGLFVKPSAIRGIA